MEKAPNWMLRGGLTLALFVASLAIAVLGYWAAASVSAKRQLPELLDLASRFPPSELRFSRRDLGQESAYVPRIANVQTVDLNRDGRLDVLACDAVSNTIVWLKQTSVGQFEEHELLEPNRFSDPAHVTAVDIDGDLDLDLIVSVLGSVIPDDSKSGRVVLLLNNGQCEFEMHVLLSELRRVTDVQAGDLDQDGDLDLAVAEFGYDHGRILWMENVGELQFRDHELMVVPGTIHVPIADFDGDGDLDLAANVTQDEEEVWLFENQGGGKFNPTPHRVYFTTNYDLGGAGMITCDLDRDGDMDLLMIAGDNLELVYHYPQPYHGCWWLENLGDLKFAARQIGTLGGVYAVAAADLDGDDDLDVALGSMFNDWRAPGTASLVWLENDGQQNFKTWQIDDSPAHLCTLAIGDLNADGANDIVGGALHTYEPFHRLGRVVAWFNQAAEKQP